MHDPHSARLRLVLEALEDRQLPSVALLNADLVKRPESNSQSALFGDAAKNSVQGQKGGPWWFDVGASARDNARGAGSNAILAREGGLHLGLRGDGAAKTKNGAERSNDGGLAGLPGASGIAVGADLGVGGSSSSGARGRSADAGRNSRAPADGQNGSGRKVDDDVPQARDKQRGSDPSSGRSTDDSGSQASDGASVSISVHISGGTTIGRRVLLERGNTTPTADETPSASPGRTGADVVGPAAAPAVSEPARGGDRAALGRGKQLDANLVEDEARATLAGEDADARLQRDGKVIPLTDTASSAQGLPGTLYSLVRDGRLVNWGTGVMLPALTGIPAESAPSAGMVAESEAVTDEEADAEGRAPSPVGSGVLGSVLPVDVAGLEAGLRKFLAEIEGLGWQLTHGPSRIALSVAALAGSAAALAYESWRRRRRRQQGLLPATADAETRTWLPDPSSFPTDA